MNIDLGIKLVLVARVEEILVTTTCRCSGRATDNVFGRHLEVPVSTKFTFSNNTVKKPQTLLGCHSHHL